MMQYTRAASQQDDKAKTAKAIKQGGLDNLLSSLEQARKVNVLDKSRMDWGQFKSANNKVRWQYSACSQDILVANG